MTRRALALVLAPLLGCAGLIGATFDDAHLRGDAGDSGEALDVSFGEASFADTDAPFDPASMPGLALWLDATWGVEVDGDAASGTVDVWRDRSNNGRDAFPAGSGTNAPSLVPAALAGKPVVHFAAAELDLLRASWDGPGGAELTLFIVARGYENSVIRFQSDVASYPLLVFPVDFAQSVTSPSFRFWAGPDQQNDVALQTLLDGSVAVATATWRADGTAATFLDGTLVEQRIAPSAALPDNQALYVGGVLPLLPDPYTTLPFCDGDVAEAIVYAAALDDGARAAVEGYLRSKWAIGP
jgi:hypothetical protein